MSDIKEMNKYYPPDFDPETFHKHKHLLKQKPGGRRKELRKRPTVVNGVTPGRKMELRMLWPFSIECDNCKNVLFVGTKFNSKVEKVRGEDYLGVPLWRIIGICPDCRNPIILRTDPKNTDYVIERGGHRLFDAALAKKEVEEAKQSFQLKESELNQMERLEMKALNTAQEVEDLEVLENLKRMNRMLLSEDLNEELLALVRKNDDHQDDEEEALDIKQFRKLKEQRLFEDADAAVSISSSSEDGEKRERLQQPTIIIRSEKTTPCGEQQRRPPPLSALSSIAQAYDDDDSSSS